MHKSWGHSLSISYLPTYCPSPCPKVLRLVICFYILLPETSTMHSNGPSPFIGYTIGTALSELVIFTLTSQMSKLGKSSENFWVTKDYAGTNKR